MSETIIIESNREIAYRSTTEAERFAAVNETTTVPFREYPSHEWDTYIEEGIQMNVGDRLNVEACMINTRGDPTSTMEFSGGSSKIGNNPLVDNVAELEVGYYITNRHQFNFNLPLFTHKINFQWSSKYYGTPAFFNILKMQSWSYGLGGAHTGTAIDNFDYFIDNYPYDSIEGFSVSNLGSTTQTWTILPKKNTPFTKCRIDMGSANQTRLYKTTQYWEGPLEQPYSGVMPDYGGIRTKKIPLEVPIGFNSPATIGEYLTSQFHNREGDADNWDTDEIQGYAYEVEPAYGVLSQSPLPTVTDQTYITTSTSTGQLFEARKAGNWSAAFKGERVGGVPAGALVPQGTGYNENQGMTQFWNNMMTGDIKKNLALSYFNQLTNKPWSGSDFTGNFSDAPSDITTFSGAEYIINPHIGELGCMVCLLDNLEEAQYGVDTTYSDWIYKVTSSTNLDPQNTKVKQNSVVADCPYLELNTGSIVTTNIIANEQNMKILRNTFFANNYQSAENNPTIYQSPSSNSVANQVWDNMRTNWQIGRADDQYSGGLSDEGLNLINPRVAANAESQALPSITIPISYQLYSFRDYGTTATTYPSGGNPRFNECPRLIQRNIMAAGRNPNAYNTGVASQTYEIPIFTNMRSEFDPSNPYTTLRLPPDTLFSFTNSKGEYYPINNGIIAPLNNSWDVSTKNYVALVVVYYAAEKAPYHTMYDVPFIAVINSRSVGVSGPNPIMIPYPMRGELFGISNSLMNNSYSKVSSVQKTTVGTDRKPAINPTGPNYNGDTEIADYSSYCFIGADNPLIKFDPDFTRFAISSLHTSTRTGNGVFQITESQGNTQFAQEVLMAYSKEAMISGIDGFGKPDAYSGTFQTILGNPTISSQAGIGIFALRIPNVKQITDGYLNQSPAEFQGELTQISADRPNLYKGTLFSKMGFELEQLLSTWGFQNNDFNTYNATKFVGYPNRTFSKQSNMVYPLTTNAYISGAIMLSMTTNVAKDPMENLGSFRQNQSEINATSDQITALQLPSKLDYSYLVVYSDIIPNVKYYGGASGEQQIPALTYISRNYSTGDFFYSFSTDWTYIVDKPYILSHFKVSIRLPNGKPAPIEENSSIIFKIQKPKILPQQPDPDPKDKKKIKKNNLFLLNKINYSFY